MHPASCITNLYCTGRIVMAQKGGKVKSFILVAVFLVLIAVVFILMGGGNLLKSAGTWIGSMGRKAEDIKQTMEQKATSIEKTVEKKAENVEKAVKTLKEGEKPGEKK